MLPLIEVTVMGIGNVVIVIVPPALVVGCCWLKILMEEIELSFFSFCHLMHIMKLSIHQVSEFGPEWSVTNVRSCHPVAVILIDFGSVGTRVEFCVDIGMWAFFM